MPTKEVYLYDTSNQALKVAGIRVELFDAASGTLLDTKNSQDLNPGSTPDMWGVSLQFASCLDPLDIYVKDPSYRYPGNTVRYLNGDIDGEVKIDLLVLPITPNSQPAPTKATPQAILNWVNAAEYWAPEEKRAVWNLILNFAAVVGPRWDELAFLSDLHDVADNWAEALTRLGFPYPLLRQE